MGNPVFDVQLSVQGKYYFVLRAGNGEVILTSEEYETKAGMVNGINSVATNAPNLEAYQLFVGEDGKYYFNLRARNNKVIGVSEAYNWKLSRWFGIRSVRRNAVKAYGQQMY